MIFEPEGSPVADAGEIATNCIESGSDLLLLDEGSVHPAFFVLRSGMAGELLHRLSVYRIRLAVVVPDLTIHGDRFREFAEEANRGSLCRFFATREAALAWLSW